MVWQQSKTWTAADDQTLHSMWEQGFDSRAIGAELGVSSWSVGSRRRELGLRARPGCDDAGWQKPRNWTADEDERLRALWAQGLETRQIGAEMGLSSSIVASRRRVLNLPTRENGRNPHYPMPDPQTPSLAELLGLAPAPSEPRNAKIWPRPLLAEGVISPARRCQYPLWQDGPREAPAQQRFCEQPSVRTPVGGVPCSWCAAHVRVVYQPAEQQRFRRAA